MPRLRLLLLSITCAALASCASTETFRVRVLQPAPVNLGQHDLVAIDRFTGEDCDEFAAELASALRNTENPLTGRTDFEVLDRRDLDGMLDDLRRDRGEPSEQRAMDLLHRWQAAEILLTGSARVHPIEEEIREQPWVDRDGVAHTTFSRRASARISATIEAQRGEGLPLFDTARIDETASGETEAVDGPPAEIDHLALLGAARTRAVQSYMRRVLPHWVYVDVHLYIDDDLPELSLGNGYARTGDWEAALRHYRAAGERATGELAEARHKALFNSGVALLYTNRFAEARQSLEDAFALAQDDSILRELQNVARREREYQALLQQGTKAAKPQ